MQPEHLRRAHRWCQRLLHELWTSLPPSPSTARKEPTSEIRRGWKSRILPNYQLQLLLVGCCVPLPQDPRTLGCSNPSNGSPLLSEGHLAVDLCLSQKWENVHHRKRRTALVASYTVAWILLHSGKVPAWS